MNKKLFIIVIFCLLLTPFASAITGSIGNAKAIVTVDLSKSNILERTVLVKNVNDFAINIKLEPAEDIEFITEIIEKEFVLGPNEEKKAAYKVTIPKEGIYNGNIVVFFSPPEGGGAGVVLQSNLIIKAVGEGSGIIEDEEDVEAEEENINGITKSIVSEKSSQLSNLDLSLVLFVVLVAVIVIAGLTVLMRRI
ncbi:hypothetical protein J4449_01875 [Candidatus Woesearchaeota archaeon]|nr:hypothetical protein [Candidatus Woesearchaeota archaeon]